MAQLQISKLSDIIDKAVLDALAGFGFKRDETGGAYCTKDSVSYYVAADVRRVGDENRIAPFGQIGFSEANRIYDNFMWPGDSNEGATGGFHVRYSHFAGVWGAYEVCQKEDDLPRVRAWLNDLLFSRLLPCLDKYSDPRQVVSAYVSHDENQSHSVDVLSWAGHSSAIHGLILARLYGTEHYPALKQRYGPLLELLRADIKDRARKLLSYLDMDPLPALREHSGVGQTKATGKC